MQGVCFFSNLDPNYTVKGLLLFGIIALHILCLWNLARAVAHRPCREGSEQLVKAVKEMEGDHTCEEFLLVEPDGKNVKCKRIGGTTDISAGQLIDRTGVMLGLPFPAGKHLDLLSKDAKGREVFKVKCPGTEFSLSGVQNKVQQFHNGSDADTAAYALRCVAYAVYKATENALKLYPGLEVVFSGGVASNSMLRELTKDLNPVFCEPQYSTDNALGVAVLTHRLLEG